MLINFPLLASTAFGWGIDCVVSLSTVRHWPPHGCCSSHSIPSRLPWVPSRPIGAAVDPIPSARQWIPSHRGCSGSHPIRAATGPIPLGLQWIPSYRGRNGSHPIGAAMDPIPSGLQRILSHHGKPAHERASKLAKENVGHNHQIIQLTIPIENLIKTQKCTRLIKHNVTIIYRTELGRLLSN